MTDKPGGVGILPPRTQRRCKSLARKHFLMTTLVLVAMTLVILKMIISSWQFHSFKISERDVMLMMKGDAILKLLHQRGLNLHHISALIPGVNKMSLNENLFTREGCRPVPRRET